MSCFFFLSDVDPNSDADYTSESTFTFDFVLAATVSTGPIVTATLDNVIHEGVECKQVDIDTGSIPTGASVGDIGHTSICIIDRTREL